MKRGGRPEGSERTYKGTHKPRAAPTLRRDPAAQVKLSIVLDWSKHADKHGVEKFKSLPADVRNELQQKWHWSTETVARWNELRPALEKKVATARLGKYGLRACGVARLKGKSQSEGARLTKESPGTVTPKRPLEGVMHRLECWFKREREHGHEVRRKTIVTQLKFQLEFERDKQLHLKDIEHFQYDAEILKRITKRLETFRIHQMCKKDNRWIDDFVLPRLRASGYKGQKMSEQKNKTLDKEKAKLTWATADRFLHLVARGSEEDLSLFVGDTEHFIEHRKSTSVVVVDATALWLKLRGEEKVYLHESELQASSAKLLLKKTRRKFRDAVRGRQGTTTTTTTTRATTTTRTTTPTTTTAITTTASPAKATAATRIRRQRR